MSNRVHFSVTLVVVIFVFANSFGQKTTFDCSLLQNVLKNDKFTNHFSVCKHQDEILRIIDTASYFVKCNLATACNRKVILSRVWPSNVNPNKRTSEEHKNKIIIYNAHVNGNIYTLHFWEPYTNRTCVIEGTLNKNKTEVKVVSAGVF